MEGKNPTLSFMYIVNMASGCRYKETLLVSLDDLENIPNSLDEIMIYKKKLLIYLMKYFIFKFEENRNQSVSKYTQNMFRNMG